MSFKSVLCVTMFAYAAAAVEMEIAPFRGELEKNATGTVNQESAIASMPEGRVVKSGEGEWILPGNAVRQNSPFNVVVNEGTLTLTNDDGVRPPIDGINDILNDACLWLAADNETNIVTEESGDVKKVTRWCDVRETNPQSPTRVYARSGEAGKEPTLKASTYSPESQGVYFGGYKSGEFMALTKTDGTLHDFTGVREVFLVMGISNSVGNVIGPKLYESSNDSCTGLYPSSDGSYFNKYPNNSNAGIIRGSRTYRDGELIDPFSDPLRTGTQLLNVRLTHSTATGFLKMSYLFRFKNNDTSSRGGDYLHEMLLFDRQLTEVESHKVQCYLTEKWGLSKTCAKNIDAQAGATVRLSCSANGSMGEVNAVGEGAYEKAGEGSIFISRTRGEKLPGTIRLASGGMLVRKDVGLKIAGGDSVTASDVATGVSLVNSPDSGNLTRASQQGNGALIVDEIADEVAKYSVGEGSVLVLRGREHVKSETVVRVPNGSFEDGATSKTYAGVHEPSGWTIHDVTNLVWNPPTGQAGNIASLKYGATDYGWPATPYTSAGMDVIDGQRFLIMCGINGAGNMGYIVSDSFEPAVNGRFKLVAQAKFYCSWIALNFSPNKFPTVSASLIVNGNESAPIELGSLNIRNQWFKKLAWPVAFTIKDTDRVQVRLQVPGSDSCVMVDDVRFEEDSEYLVNGNFDDILYVGNPGTEECDPKNPEYSNWDSRVPKWWVRKNNVQGEKSQDTASVIEIKDGSWEKDWTKEVDTGTYVLRLGGKGSLEQRVTFDEAGVYRLRFMINTTLDKSWIYGKNSVRAWLVNEANETNQIYFTTSVSSNLVDRTALFRVPVAGTYLFGLQGTATPVASGRVATACVDSVSVTKYAGDDGVKIPS